MLKKYKNLIKTIIYFLLLIFIIYMVIENKKLVKENRTKKEITNTKMYLIPFRRNKKIFQIIVSSTDGSMNVNYFISRHDLTIFRKDINKLIKIGETK